MLHGWVSRHTLKMSKYVRASDEDNNAYGVSLFYIFRSTDVPKTFQNIEMVNVKSRKTLLELCPFSSLSIVVPQRKSQIVV